MHKFFSAPGKKKLADKPIIIVSGLPRSGTSMMMKMLNAGGLQIVSDEIRRADDDNPNGYFELEAVKQLAQGNFMWLQSANGKVVKVISSLLEYLPSQYSYKVIFMEREIREILASQQKMLANRNEVNRAADAEMELQFRNHIAVVKAWLVRQENIEVLYVNYNSLIADPKPLCKRISDFIGIPLNMDQMLSVPTEKLYRNRTVTEQ
ncbi:MAG TPA: sulfotransferase domain-containing protein [Anaerolineales bacterium]|nr:sulfotransferase domain-containing protein [Anaerolineales bacterium]